MAETDTVGKPPPKAGEVVNGYRFSGGDPNDKNNWKQEAVKPPVAGDVRNGYRFKGGDPNTQANWVQEPQQPVQVTPEAAAPLPKWGPLTPFDAPNTGVAVGGSIGQPMPAPGSLPPSGPEPPTDGRRFTDEYLNDVQRAPIQGPAVQQPMLAPGQQVQPPVQQAVEAADRFNAIEGEKKALRSPGLMMESEEGRQRLAGIAEWSDQIAKDDNLTFLQWKTAGDQLAPGPIGVNVDPRWEKVMADYRNVAPAIGDRKTTMTQQEYDERFAAGDLTPAQSIGYNMDALEFQARRLAGRSIKIKDALAKGISPNILQQDMEDVQAGYDYVQGKMAELAKQDPRSFADRVRQAAQEKSNEMKSDPAYQQERMAGSAILGARDVLANTVAGAVRMLDFSDGYSLGDKASDWAEGLEKDGQAALDDQYKDSMLHKLAYAGGQMGGLMLGGAGGAAGKAPIVASALASEFEGYTRQAMADGATQKQAEAGAMLYAPLSAAIELLNPQDVLAADGLKGFRGQFIKLVNDGITPKKAMSMAVESAEAGVKESIEELMQTLAERATNAGVNAISGTDLNEDLPTATEVAETVFISTLLGAVAQVPGSINQESARPRLQAEAMQWAATHPEEVQAIVEKLPEEQRADFTERMDAMAKTYTGNGLTKMPPEQAAKISDLIDQKAAVEQEIKDAPMDPVVESAMPEGDPRKRRVSDITKELLLAVQEGTIAPPTTTAQQPDSQKALDRDSFKEAFGVSDEVADATIAIADAMGLDKTKIKVAKGGEISPDALFQQEQEQWRSRLSESIAAKGQTLPADQWANWLQSRAKEGAFSMEEAKWTGLSDWLSSKGKEKVTPQQVREFLNKNRVRVEVKELGGVSDNVRVIEEEDGSFSIYDGDEFVEVYDTRDEAESNISNYKTVSSDTKFSQYQLPGGPLARDTEILTRDGWKRIDAVAIGEEVLTRIDESGILEWNPVEAKPEVFAEKLHHFFSQSIDMRVTPCHKMVIKRRRRSSGKIMRVTAEELWSMSECLVPLTGKWQAPAMESLFGLPANDVAELVGWYVAEGSSVTDRNSKKSTLSISQSRIANTEKCDRLEALFTRLGIKWNYVESGPAYYLSIRSMPRGLVDILHAQGTSEFKHVPRLFMDAPQDVMRSLLDGLILGDGHTRTTAGRKEQKLFFSKSKQLADDVQVLALMTGSRASVRQRPSGIYVVGFNHKQWAGIDDAKHAVVDYNDTAYCVTVKNHAIYVRTNGVAAFTGNSNYREVLVTLPKRGASQAELDAMAQEQYGRLYAELNDAQQSNTLSYVREARKDPEFRSSHFDEPNILFHLRVNDRVDAEGRRVLFIEEIQSDWSQTGRKKGFRTENVSDSDTKGIEALRREAEEKATAYQSAAKALEDERVAIRTGIQKKHGYTTALDFVKSPPSEKKRAVIAEMNAAVSDSATIPEMEAVVQRLRNAASEAQGKLVEAQERIRLTKETPPSAPFVTDTSAWVELAMKQAVRMAVEGGYDRVAWTKGQHHTDRWGTERIEWAKQPDGSFLVNAKAQHGGQAGGVDLEGEANAQNLNPQNSKTVSSREQLEETIRPSLTEGQDAKKLSEKLWGRMQSESSGVSMPRKEGFEGFYDKIVPTVAAKVIKKMGGGKVGETTLPGIAKDAGTGWERAGGQMVDTAPSSQPSFDITPEMKASVRQGVPLMQGKKGSVEFVDGGKAIIRALENPDASTGIHELAHVARRFLFDKNIKPEERSGITDEHIDTAEKWAGAKDGNWSTEAEEKFARGFERYLRDGKAPNEGLKDLFSRFSQWLKDIYTRLSSSPIKRAISPEMREVFDTLITRNAPTTTAKQATADKGGAKTGTPDVPVLQAKSAAAEPVSPDEAEPVSSAAAPEKIEPVYTKDVKDDPRALAEAYLAERRQHFDEANPDRAFFNTLRGSVNRSSFVKAADENVIGDQIAKTYFASKKGLRTGERSGKPIDSLAQELTEALGREVTVDDVVQFILRNPSGIPMRNARMIELDDRHQAIVGKKLNSLSAKALLARTKGQPPAWTPNEQAIVDEVAASGYDLSEVEDKDVEDYGDMSDEDKDIMFGGGSTIAKFDLNANRKKEQVQPGSGSEDAGEVRSDEDQGATGAEGEDGESAEDAGESAEEKVAAAKRIADRLRQIGDSLAGGDVVFSSIIPPTLIRQALHFAADVIEKGGEVVDAIARAVAHIRESDWFKALPKDEVEEAEANIKEVEQRIKEGASGDYTRVQQRRLKAEDVSDQERKRILSSTIQDPKDFQKVKEAAKEEFEQAKKDTAELDVLQAVADIKKRVDAIENPIARTYLLGALHQHVHSLSRSDSTTGPEKLMLQDVAGQLTNLKGKRGREMGQAIAMYADVYNEFGMFATLVRASRIEQQFEEALDDPNNGVDGQTPRESINQVRKELDEALDGSPELKAYLETLKKINAALREAFALQVLAGKKSPLEQPPSLSLMDTFTKEGQQRIDDLEETLEKTLDELEKLYERYEQVKGRKHEYAKKINELKGKLKAAEEAIDALRSLKGADPGTKAKLRKQNEQLAASVEKSPGLLQAMKKAQDRASKKKTNRSLIEDVLRVVRTGALWDDDLSAVFADVFALKGFGEQERTMVQHFAYALEYFEDTRQREMADRYTKALNMYLDKASLDITKAARVGRFLQDMLYHHMLSGIGTFFNANGGTTLQAILHSTAGALDHMLRPDGGLGAVVYGARRWAKEHPAALSKALHYTSAFNKAGSMFDTNTAARGSVYEDEVLNGFFRAWDKARKAQTPGGKLKWGSATIAIAASQAVRFGHMMRAMDAYFTHSMVAYRTAMGEYEKMSKELALPKTPLASWGQRLNPATLRKIDEAVGYGRQAREAAGKQADQDIKNLEASGIKVSPGYRTRRVSEILQEQREKEMQDLNLEITRDMLLMGAPDGLPGFGAQKLAKGSRIEDTDKAWRVGRKVALAAILPFMRVTASSINQAQLGIPILGMLGAKYGYGKDSTGNWRLMDKGVESPEKTRHRMFVSFLLTSIFLGVMADMFDWEDDEEGGKLVLDPNRNIDLTANAYGNYKLNEGIGEGYQMFSFRKRDGDSWSDYYSTRLLPGIASGMAIAGRLSDDAKGLYQYVPGKKSTPASAMETTLVAPFNALGEASFNSVGRAWKKWKYAKDTDQTSAIGFDLLLQPVATAVQPSIYRDAVNIGAMAAGEPASQRRYIDTPEDAMINAAASIYGLDMLLLQDRADEFGIPVERQDAMRNWMHGLTDEDQRSLDHKEVKLRFSYPGINMPDKRYRPPSLDAPTVKVPFWDKDKDKGKIYLTTEQRDVIDLFSRAAFRKRVLKNYDDIVETAKKWEEKHGAGAAFISQAMSELRNDANAEARDLFFQVNAGKKTLDDMRAKTVRYQADADKNEEGEKGK